MEGISNKRYKFPVNTSTICFLCFNETNPFNICEDNDLSLGFKSIYSVQNLLRYLKINLNGIKSFSSKSKSLLNRTDIRVNLCSECGGEVERFSELYKARELIQMKLEFSLGTIKGKMGKLEKDPNLLERYKTRIKEGKEEQALKHSKIVEELRNQITKQCNLKTPKFQPALKLDKINVEEELIKHDLRNPSYPRSVLPTNSPVLSSPPSSSSPSSDFISPFKNESSYPIEECSPAPANEEDFANEPEDSDTAIGNEPEQSEDDEPIVDKTVKVEIAVAQKDQHQYHHHQNQKTRTQDQSWMPTCPICKTKFQRQKFVAHLRTHSNQEKPMTNIMATEIQLPVGRRRVGKVSPLSPADMRLRKKMQNLKAAKHYRMKVKQNLNSYYIAEENFQRVNQELVKTAENLRKEVTIIRHLLREKLKLRARPR